MDSAEKRMLEYHVVSTRNVLPVTTRCPGCVQAPADLLFVSAFEASFGSLCVQMMLSFYLLVSPLEENFAKTFDFFGRLPKKALRKQMSPNSRGLLIVIVTCLQVLVSCNECSSADVGLWNETCWLAAGSAQGSRRCELATCLANYSIEAVTSRRAAGEVNSTLLLTCTAGAPLAEASAWCSDLVVAWRESPELGCAVSSADDTEKCLAALPCRSSLSELCNLRCLAWSVLCFVAPLGSTTSASCNASQLSAVCMSALWRDWALCGECGANSTSCSAARCDAAAVILTSSGSGSGATLSLTMLYIIVAAGAAGCAVIVSAIVICCFRSRKIETHGSMAAPGRARRYVGGRERDEEARTPPLIRRGRRDSEDCSRRTFATTISPAESESPADSTTMLQLGTDDSRPFSFGELLEHQNRVMRREAQRQEGAEGRAPARGWEAPNDDDEEDEADHHRHHQFGRNQNFDQPWNSMLQVNADGISAVEQYVPSPDELDEGPQEDLDEPFGDGSAVAQGGPEPAPRGSSGPMEWHGEHWRPTSRGNFESPAKSTPSKGNAVSDYALYSDDDLEGDLRVNPFEDEPPDDLAEADRGLINSQQTHRPLSHQQQQGSMSLGELEFAFTERSQSSAGTDLGQAVSRPASEHGEDHREIRGRSRVRRKTTSANSSQRASGPRALSDSQRRDAIAQTIKCEQWRRGRLLGRGASGAVYQAIFPSGLTLACKEVDVKLRTPDEITKMGTFFEQLVKLQHPNIIECYAVTYDAANCCLQQWMELVKGGSLHRLARKASGVESRAATPTSKMSSDKDAAGGSGLWGAAANTPGLSEPVVAEYTRQMLSGLALLHRQGIIHRDIKGSNVLLTDDRRAARIIDFDSATIASAAISTGDTPSVVGTPLWMAPEIITMKGACSSAADVWSLGITVAELMDGGNPPWPVFENTWSAMLHLASTNARPRVPVGVSSELHSFLEQCWNPDPRGRATTAELMGHPWLECRCGTPNLLVRSTRSEGSGANSEVQSVASSSGGLGP
jgi:serine/threonine protein kinase